ncbi:MAG TPA: efflux RND transporter periplasmic adaptor subunit [Candidatus Eisenbacteria bacterium]|jgi:RND family efflux transporter MFP subunit
MSTSPPRLSDLRIDRGTSEPARGRRRWALWLLAVLAVAAGVAWWAARPPAPLVHLALAGATGGGTLSSEGISANGYVVARTKASVSARIPGRLQYLGVTEGSRVKAGEVIARIESGDFEAQLASARATAAEAEAQLAQARRDRERSRALRREGLSSDAELENAETRVSVLEAQLNAAQANQELARVNLENTRVQAPFDGTVLRKDAEVGEIVAPSSAGGGLTRTAIVTMADLATLEVEVDVNEAYIAQIQNGQAARITLDAYPDTSFAGKVRQVVPTADRQKATVQVKVSILDRDPRILPEMGAKVVFLRERESGPLAVAPRRVTVPAAAVITSADGSRVWVVVDGRAVAHEVEVGPAHGDQVEVRKGLAGGESVVVNPPAGIRNGARVRVAGS